MPRQLRFAVCSTIVILVVACIAFFVEIIQDGKAIGRIEALPRRNSPMFLGWDSAASPTSIGWDRFIFRRGVGRVLAPGWISRAYSPFWDIPVGVNVSGAALDRTAIEDIAMLDSLESLDLSHTGVTTADLETLCSLSDLRQLGLQGTCVGDDVIAVLLRFESLNEIDIRDTQITDDGMNELRQMRPAIVVSR